MADLEGAFSDDLSDVKVYAEADGAAELGAVAYGSGSDVYFGGDPGGEDLLAHEAAHVVQQKVGDADPEAEIEGE